MAYQIGIVALSQFLPKENMESMENIVRKCKSIVGVRKEIQQWLNGNGELK